MTIRLASRIPSTISRAAPAPFAGLNPASGLLRCFVSAVTSRAIASTSSPRPPPSAAPTTVRSVAAVSFTASIGPPGSASEIAMPAMNGARLSCVHSSSVKSVFDVMSASSGSGRPS